MFFDDTQRTAPTTRVEFEAGEHIYLMDEPNRPLDVDRVLAHMVWHARHQQDPAHLWLRNELEAVVALYF